MPDALELHDLHRRYGDVRAVDGIDLEVADGERFALLGPSGSGKTTVLRLIAGFEQPDEGRVVLRGEDVAGRPPEHRNVGVVFQDYALFPHRTVAQNIEFGPRMRGLDRGARRTRVAELLDLVDMVGEANRRPHQLSGGQRQRVALARALAPEPSLLLLDEPLANLDRRLRESLRDELVAITSAVGVTTVLVTHDQEEALSFADRVGVLRDGRLVQSGTPQQLWRTPANRFVATFLGDMNLLPAAVEDGAVRVAVLPDPLGLLGESPAGPVVACLRPEALVVRPRAAGSATVTDVRYAGGTVTYTVRIADETVTVREQRPDGDPGARPGDQADLTAAVPAVAVLPAAPTPSTPASDHLPNASDHVAGDDGGQ